ncbi:MAG: hypothetical protein R3B72_47080 [Polyangiaceae bacterium]
MHDLDADVKAYAALAAALAHAADRGAVLDEHGLDEDGWEALEERWSERLAADEESFGDRDGVPPLLVAYAEAFAEASRRADASSLLGFEAYVAITRELARGREVDRVLKAHQVPLYLYLESHHHWTLRLATDTELAARFRDLMYG